MDNRTVFGAIGTAIAGVMVATSVAHTLTPPEMSWSGLPWMWIVGAIVAIPHAVVFGLPAFVAFRKYGLGRWWHYAIGGVLIAVPCWVLIAQPFDSARWRYAGGYDSVNILGTGLVAAILFWAMERKRSNAL